MEHIVENKNHILEGNKYIVVIGLEIHVELSTKSKMFCSCSTEHGGEHNTRCCPICIGMPGTLPLMNKKAVEYAIRAGLAMNCTISEACSMDRKNYFYPDLPKAYQISQNDNPLCKNGYIFIEHGGNSVASGEKKKIGIERIHIEEDAGKLVHCDNYSLVDYNRSGIPLIEIVSEPELRSAEEAKTYIESIKSILQYIGVSKCKMEEGSLRVDVNLSVAKEGSLEMGTRTEVKNLNSLKSITRAIEFESNRQIIELSEGRKILQETRRWDDIKGLSFPMRSKEEASDYRYFHETDIVTIKVENSKLNEIKSSLPELPDSRKERYIIEYGLPEYDAMILTRDKSLSDFFEAAIMYSKNIKAVSNWVMGEIIKILKLNILEANEIPFPAKYLARLVELIDNNVISTTTGKTVLQKMFENGAEMGGASMSPDNIIENEGLAVLNDRELLTQVVKDVIAKNTKSVKDYLGGKDKALGFLTGQAMKETKGKAEPMLIKELLIDEIS